MCTLFKTEVQVADLNQELEREKKMHRELNHTMEKYRRDLEEQKELLEEKVLKMEELHGTLKRREEELSALQFK